MNKSTVVPTPVSSSKPWDDKPLVFRFDDDSLKADMEFDFLEPSFDDLTPIPFDVTSGISPTAALVAHQPLAFDFQGLVACPPSPILKPNTNDKPFEPLKDALMKTRRLSLTDSKKQKTVGVSAKKFAKRRPRMKWSKKEDELLLGFLSTMSAEGLTDALEPKVYWIDVALAMRNGRTAKQCRDRWQNYLRPGIKKGHWTKAEEVQIREMYRTMGPKWVEMTKCMKERAENDIKNKWYSMMRSERRRGGGGADADASPEMGEGGDSNGSTSAESEVDEESTAEVTPDQAPIISNSMTPSIDTSLNAGADWDGEDSKMPAR